MLDAATDRAWSSNTVAEQTYSVIRDEERHVWSVPRLWRLSRTLTPFDYPVASFSGLDRDCWFCGVRVPTVRSVLEHVRRIEALDSSYPIILDANGAVMDGVHRICRALLRGQETVLAVQFLATPQPDEVLALDRGAP